MPPSPTSVPLSLPSTWRAMTRSSESVVALWDLTKPRLALFSVLSAMTGYLLACADQTAGSMTVLLSFIGIAMAAGGALSFNQCLEWAHDARMRRTRDRPIPSGRIPLSLAMVWSAFLSLSGPWLLSLLINPMAGALAAATIFIYACLYTPMKRHTPWATEVGSVSGALPPLIGAAAAGSVLAPDAWIFGVFVLLWQMPHFFAIGWLHREDYARAGFRLRPAIDPTGGNTAAWICIYACALAGMAAASFLLGWSSWVFALGAVPLSLVYLFLSIRFLRRPAGRDRVARLLFALTIIHLPVVMVALVLERLARH